jgi:hypothetical protein
LLLLAVLFPVAVYLAVLGWINRRPRGVLVSGPWDFVGVLFAASGFLLLGGPALLSSLTQTDTWRNFWVLGKFTGRIPLEQRLALGRVVLFGGYFLLVVSLAAFLLWRRRRLTSIYNVDPSLVENVLGQTFERWRVPFVQTGNLLVIDPGVVMVTPTDPPEGDGPRTASRPVALVDRVTRLEIEASLGMCHVTLWWDPPGSLLRREVEGQLRLALAEHEAPGGAVGDWLLIASSGLFFLLLLGAGVIALVRLLRP